MRPFSSSMDKRERLEKTIAGELTDRLPVALWRYWQGDDQRAADLARAHLDFQQSFDWDILIVAPPSNFMLTGYGLQDEWRGAATGKRDIIKTPVHRSLDWTDLRPLDPGKGDFARQIQCLQLIRDSLDKEQPLLQVVYSPLSQALSLAGKELLLRNMRSQPDRLRTGLNSLTESTLRFMETLRRQSKLSGLLYVVDAACYTLLSESEYQTFGLPYDEKLLDSLPSDWWLNMIQVNGEAPILHLLASLPVQALNWSDREARPALERAQLAFKGALCGGLGEDSHLHLGTPTTVRDAARDAMGAMSRRRLILGSGRSVPVTTPLSNLRAAREVVETTSR
jgi:uroporphyrinogen decarboxylase